MNDEAQHQLEAAHTPPPQSQSGRALGFGTLLICLLSACVSSGSDSGGSSNGGNCAELRACCENMPEDDPNRLSCFGGLDLIEGGTGEEIGCGKVLMVYSGGHEPGEPGYCAGSGVSVGNGDGDGDGDGNGDGDGDGDADTPALVPSDWSDRFFQSTGGFEEHFALAPDGYVLLTDFSGSTWGLNWDALTEYGNGFGEAWTLKFIDLHPEWRALVEADDMVHVWAGGLAVSDDGVFVLGKSNRSWFLTSFDHQRGERRWIVELDGTERDGAGSIAMDPFGQVYILVRLANPLDVPGMLDAATGAPLEAGDPVYDDDGDLLVYSSDGELIRATHLKHTTLEHLEVTPQGAAYVVPRGIPVIRIAEDGRIDWTSESDQLPDWASYELEFDSCDGGDTLIAAGRLPGDDDELNLVSISTSTQTVLWTHVVDSMHDRAPGSWDKYLVRATADCSSIYVGANIFRDSIDDLPEFAVRRVDGVDGTAAWTGVFNHYQPGKRLTLHALVLTAGDIPGLYGWSDGWFGQNWDGDSHLNWFFGRLDPDSGDPLPLE